MPSWVDDKARYKALARSVDPACVLVTKDDWTWTVLAWALWALSFGRFSRQWFLEQAATTIGPVQAYPASWPTISMRLIFHESRHTRQARWFGMWISPWLGLPIMAVAYALFPLPMGVAWGRWWLERDAELYAWRRMPDRSTMPRSLVHFAENIGSVRYLWAWPRAWAQQSLLRGAKKLGLG